MARTVQVVSPVDGSVYAERAVADDAQVARALDEARAAQADWKRRPLAARAAFVTAVR